MCLYGSKVAQNHFSFIGFQVKLILVFGSLSNYKFSYEYCFYKGHKKNRLKKVLWFKPNTARRLDSAPLDLQMINFDN